MRNVYKYSKLYSGADPEFIEGNVFKTIIPLVSNDRVKVNSSDQVGDQAENIEKIIKFCKNPKTRSEIQEFIGNYSFY